MQTQPTLILIGGGPTGLVLANLVGEAGISVLVLERQPAVFPVPRATHLDEETLRNFQATGLLAQLAPYTSPFGAAEVTDEKGKVIFREEMAQAEAVYGFRGSRFFDQPAFERILEAGLARFPEIAFRRGIEVTDIQQDETGVRVQIQAPGEDSGEWVRADWAVGCDGGRSIVRTRLGIAMESLEPAREWVIVDSLLNDPEDAALLPDNFQYIFNSERLTIYAHGFGLNRRWEFQLAPDEPMPEEAVIRSWVAQYIEPERVRITRITKYAHNSLVATTWRQGRIFLAGDAAHMMPPSAGQGLCSGVRDAVNLAWKLAAVIRQQAPESLLDTYEQERKPHLMQILKRTLFFSSRVQGDTEWQRIWRKVTLQLIENLPPLKAWLRATYNSPPLFSTGALMPGMPLAGHPLPQSPEALTDDALGYRWVLLALPGALTTAQTTAATRAGIFVPDARIQADFAAWLSGNHVGFALVRPDKIVFGAGKRSHFPLCMEALPLFPPSHSSFHP